MHKRSDGRFSKDLIIKSGFDRAAGENTKWRMGNVKLKCHMCYMLSCDLVRHILFRKSANRWLNKETIKHVNYYQDQSNKRIRYSNPEHHLVVYIQNTYIHIYLYRTAIPLAISLFLILAPKTQSWPKYRAPFIFHLVQPAAPQLFSPSFRARSQNN